MLRIWDGRNHGLSNCCKWFAMWFLLSYILTHARCYDIWVTRTRQIMGGTGPLEFVPNVRCSALWGIVLVSCYCHSFFSLDCSNEPVFLRRVILMIHSQWIYQWNKITDMYNCWIADWGCEWVSNPSFKMRMDDKMSCLLICGDTSSDAVWSGNNHTNTI